MIFTRQSRGSRLGGGLGGELRLSIGPGRIAVAWVEKQARGGWRRAARWDVTIHNVKEPGRTIPVPGTPRTAMRPGTIFGRAILRRDANLMTRKIGSVHETSRGSLRYLGAPIHLHKVQKAVAISTAIAVRRASPSAPTRSPPQRPKQRHTAPPWPISASRWPSGSPVLPLKPA